MSGTYELNDFEEQHLFYIVLFPLFKLLLSSWSFQVQQTELWTMTSSWNPV